MKKWIFGLGAFALAFAMLVAPMDTKVQAAETTVSSGNAGSVSDNDAGSTTTKTKLATPTGLTWDGWKATWNTVENANGAYRLEIYKDGKRENIFTYGTSSKVKETMAHDYASWIVDSGVYTFRVQALNKYDPDNYENSSMSEFSAEKTYVRPEKELGTVIGTWDDTREGYFIVPMIEGAGEYALELYYTAEGEVEKRKVTTYVSAKSGETLEKDYNSSFQKYGAGKYRIKVRAISTDVETIANGALGEFSAYYDTTMAASGVNDKLKEYIEAGTATEAKQNIMANISQANLATSMQTDEAVLETIKQLEEKYAAEKGITVTSPAVSEKASEYVKADDIKVVGAGLNGTPGETVKLDVSVPEKKENVSSKRYANSVQLDIKLLSNTSSIHKLDIPITITMKIPKQIKDLDRLVILHYHTNHPDKDKPFDTVTPLINKEKGTLTFTVTEFSTFVFAEKVDSKDEEEEPNDDEEEVKEEISATPAKDNVPKTGDSLPVALPMTVAVCLAGAAVVLRKKEN